VGFLYKIVEEINNNQKLLDFEGIALSEDEIKKQKVK